MRRTLRYAGLSVLMAALPLVAPPAGAQTKPAPSALLPLDTIWTGSLPAAPAAPAVATADRLFVPLRDGTIAAVALDDGSLVWQVPQSTAARPAVGNDLLFVATRDRVIALETDTGQAGWSAPIDAPLSAPLVWNAGWLIVALETHTVLALRAQTGAEIWQRELAGGIAVAPALAGDRMYVSLQTGEVVALALLTGQVVWERKLEGAPQEILPLDDLFVGATDNHFYRLSRADGSIKWRWRTGGDVVGLPAVDERRVYFSSLDNMLWALSRSNGVQQWREPLLARPTAGPRYADDLLMQGGTSPVIRFFSPIDGQPYGALTAPSELAFEPLTVTDPSDGGPVLLLVTGDGRLQTHRHAKGPTRLDPGVATLLPLATAATGAADEDAAPTDAPGPGGTAPDTNPIETEPTVPALPAASPETTQESSPPPRVAQTAPPDTPPSTASETSPVAADNPPPEPPPAITPTPPPVAEPTPVTSAPATSPAAPATAIEAPPTAETDGVLTDGRSNQPRTPTPTVIPPPAPPPPLPRVPAPEPARRLAEPSPTATLDPPPPLRPDPAMTGARALLPTLAPNPSEPDRRASTGDFAVQVGAFANPDNARAMANRLVDQGYPAYVLEPHPSEDPALYRARIGDYPDRAAAEAIGRQVESQQQLDWYVVALP